MSLFSDLEQTGYVFLPVDNNTTKKTTYDDDFAIGDADFTIEINVLELGYEERVIFEQEQATNKANVKGTNANLLTKGAVIRVGDERFMITNTPKINKLFVGTYTIRLQKTNG